MNVNTVCLCGSTRFAAEFAEANRELTRRGFSVVTISEVLPRGADGEELPEDVGVKDLLDLVHLNKILRSDAVLVVGDGYVGRSTAREVLWANMQGRPVIWGHAVPKISSEDDDNWGNVYHRLLFGETSHSVIQRARNVLGLSRE